MKKFRFGLEALLKSRRLNENEALRVLAEAQKKLQIELENKKSLQLQLENALKDREKLGSSAVPVAGFQLVQNFITGLKQKLIKADHAIFRANRSVDKAMKSYLHAKKLTRMIDTLKDQAFSEFKLRLKKAEQKEQDELNVMRNHFLKSEEEAE